MTQEEIDALNKSGKYDSWNQGIYKEPWCAPHYIKEHLVYMRWNTGGVAGGSCWDTGEDDNLYDYDGEPEPEFKALDAVCEYLLPNMTLFQYKRVRELIESNSHTDWQYYGNYDNYEIKYVVLSKLEKLIEEFKE